MTLLVCICNQPDRLEEILEGFVEVGVTGATVLDTVGMGQILSTEVPIFAGFQSLFRGASTGNKTILSVIDDPAKVQGALDIIDEVFGGIDRPGSGIVFTVPIENVRGLAPEFE
jgi:nitrogen regulatory protein PII